jgi:hypothetical protein
MAAVIGRYASLTLNVIEYARSFHANTKLKHAAVTTVGLEIGTTTRKNDVSTLQPSILAASTSSFGIFMKFGRSISTTNGIETVAVERIGARYEFSRCIFEKVRYSGVSTREAGSICVIRKISKKSLEPFTLNFARP